MQRFRPHSAIILILTSLLMGVAYSGVFAESPTYGGILTFVVPAEPPSFDGHRETTFALIHPIAPFYSTLIRVNPHNPGGADDFVGDLALEVPEPTEGGTTYTFNLREDAKFADGRPVTADDVLASLNKIIFPPAGVASARQAFFSMVDRVYARDAFTVVFELRYPSAAFLPALASRSTSSTAPKNWHRTSTGTNTTCSVQAPSYSTDTSPEPSSQAGVIHISTTPANPTLTATGPSLPRNSHYGCRRFAADGP